MSPPHEQEALAILFALQSFHCYLHCTEFVLHTDHKPITYIKNNKENICLGFLKQISTLFV